MLFSRYRYLRHAPRLFVLAAAIYGFCWITGFPRQYDDDELPPDTHRHKDVTLTQPYHVENDQLVVSIRTTAADVYAKLPPLLLLTNQIYHNTLLIMGDLPMDIGPFHVHDVLDRLDKNLIAQTPDLTRYRRQLALSLASVNIERAKEKTAKEEKDAIARLDKYKVLRTLERAWELKRDRKWYVFVDTETYLLRANLMAWLGQFDPSEAIFFANAPDPNSDNPVSISGTTFILSGAAMHALFVDHAKNITLWDAHAKDYRSSFDVLYSALSTELSIGINSTWPAMSGFHPHTVPFGPGLWCERVVAMHSVPIATASNIWLFERERQEYHHNHGPLLFADLWTRFIQRENLALPRDDWDNLSSGLENARWNILFEGAEPDTQRHQQGHDEARAAQGEESWQACQQSCTKNEQCVQWAYSSVATPNFNGNGATRCHVSRSMRLGGSVEPVDMLEEGGKVTLAWKSGWKKGNFQGWARQQRCKGHQS